MSRPDLATTIILLTMAVGFGRLVAERVPATWPRSLVYLLPTAVVGIALGIGTRATTYLWRWVGLDVGVPIAVLVLGLLAAAVGRQRGLSWTLALWLGGALVLIGLVTLPSSLGAPRLLDDGGARLYECVTRRSRWFPTGEYWDGGTTVVLVQAVANVALFVPFGMGLGLLRARPRWLLALAPPLLTSMAIETFQALFTARVCAPNDVMCNALGGLLGFCLSVLVLHVARARHRAVSEPPDPDARDAGAGGSGRPDLRQER